MMSLDEVIQAFDDWEPDCDNCPMVCGATNEDDCTLYRALTYLREYREICKALNPKARKDENIG